jgi:hypothetical protein
MKKRVVWVCLVVGFLVAAAGTVQAKGPCKMDVDVIECELNIAVGTDEGRLIALLDKRCESEGRKCRGQATCETVYTEVACIPPGDSDPSLITIGLGCFCGGGSPPVPMPRRDPVSAQEALRIIEAIEAAEAESPALCEAPQDLKVQ